MVAPTSVRRVLTGISPSGIPHLGNYAGAIRPAIAASRRPGVEGFFFLADYHALITTVDPARLRRFTLGTAAAWLAAGLDPERVIFYRQSDIPEILELTWLLTSIRIEQQLQQGGVRARAVATSFLGELRQAVGLANLVSGITA